MRDRLQIYEYICIWTLNFNLYVFLGSGRLLYMNYRNVMTFVLFCRFLCPPWQKVQLESKELMAACLRKIPGLSKVKLIGVWIYVYSICIYIIYVLLIWSIKDKKEYSEKILNPCFQYWYHAINQKY